MFICFQLLCNFPIFFFVRTLRLLYCRRWHFRSTGWLRHCFIVYVPRAHYSHNPPLLLWLFLLFFFFYYYSVLLRSVIRFCSLTLFWQFSLATHSRDFFFFVFFIFFIITLHCKYLTSQCRCRWQSQSLILSSLNVNVSAIYICCGCRATVFHIFIARLAERLHAAVSAH